MTFHGLGVLVFSAILGGSLVAPHGIDAVPAREDVQELTKSLDTVMTFPDNASSQETGGGLGPALPLLNLGSDVDPDSQGGSNLVHSLLSPSRERLKRMAGAWSTKTHQNQRNKHRGKGQRRIEFQEDDSDDDDDDCSSSSSSSSESSEIPQSFYQRSRVQRRRRRNWWRRRTGGMFGGGNHAPNRKKSNRCSRKHWPTETTTSGRMVTTMTTTAPTTKITTTSPTTKMTMTSPTVASESLTQAMFMTTMTTSTSSKPTREETTAAAKTTQPTTQNESSTTVTYQSTTKEVKTVGVLDPK